jgi:hypothetical protein
MDSSANLLNACQAKLFPIVVIEVPKPSYFSQSKMAMAVASQNMGGILYDGPIRSCVVRWKYISKFYIIELSVESYYLAQSLTHHPHYTILRKDFLVFDSFLTGFLKKHGSTQVKRISLSENFQDDFLLVINNFTEYPVLRNFLASIDDSQLLPEVLLVATLDTNRGNCKIDCGYSTGQNLVRELEDFGMTRPRLLDKTREPVFLVVCKDLSLLVDLVSETFSLPKYYRLDNFHSMFCQEFHPAAIIPAWRVAISRPEQFLEVHEDANNESRALMSPVGVLSRLVHSDIGPLRLTKIGYSRKSLLDCTLRQSLIQPIVAEFLKWQDSQPDILKVASNALFLQVPNSAISGVIEFPCHLERCVGISPYLHATLEIQRLLSLNRHQCIALLYHCVTSESPYFFYTVHEQIMSSTATSQNKLSKMIPLELGLWFYAEIEKLIETRQNLEMHMVLPRRHQPHNGKRTCATNIELSIRNLIELCDQFCLLDPNEAGNNFITAKQSLY